MQPVDDIGKIWVRGSFVPAPAVRVGKYFFIIGPANDKAEGETVNHWAGKDFLLVELHNEKKGERTARRFPLNLNASAQGTLFEGFKQTKHADISAVNFTDPGVESFTLRGDAYREENIAALDSQSFLKRAGFI